MFSNKFSAAGDELEMAAGAKVSRAGAALFARGVGGAMPSYWLRIPANEIVRVVRAEIEAAEGAPEFYVDGYQYYIIEEDSNCSAYGMHDENRHGVVTAEAILNIEPRQEQNYWVLSIIAHKEFAPQFINDESAFVSAPLTIDEFETGFVIPGSDVTRVRLYTQSAVAKAHFDNWWAELRARNPRGGAVHMEASPTLAGRKPSERSFPMAIDLAVANPWIYHGREVVAVFADSDALEAAVNELEFSGFDRANLSVLGPADAVKERMGRLYDTVAEIEDDKRVPRSAFVSQGSRLQGEAAALTFPLFIGGLAGAAAAVASGGALAGAVAATIVSSATGAGLGGLLAWAIGQHHAERVQEQIKKGGLVLWVSVPNEDSEKRAFAVLEKCGGQDIHAHEIEQEWGPRDRPLSEAQIDPLLLDRDPPID